MDNMFSQMKLNHNYHDKRREMYAFMAGNHTESLTNTQTMQNELKKH